MRPGVGRIVASVDVGRDAPLSLEDVRFVVAERGPSGAVVHDTTWRSRFVINERKVPDYRAGRCFLVGDAAHIHSPAGGQGMNTGMQDAANLAWKLAAVVRGLADPEPLLASYSPERSPVAEHVLAMAGRMTRVATMRGRVARRARDRVARVALAFPPARRRLRDDLSELGVAYRESPIVRDAGTGRRGLRAGDRMPDAPLARPSGRVRLHERMRDATPTLVLMGGASRAEEQPGLLALARALRDRLPEVDPVVVTLAAGPAGDVERLTDVEGALHAAVGADGPIAVVVRPDGYVGLRLAPPSVAEVMAHFRDDLGWRIRTRVPAAPAPVPV